MHGTDSRSCPLADFDISGVEPSGSAVRELGVAIVKRILPKMNVNIC
jgi:hypothetical protein